jgi:hypothetical protein
VEINQLQGARKESNGEVTVTHHEAFLVTQWLERGVFAAVEKEFLHSMTFAIFKKHPTQQTDLLLETYEFKISYRSANGGPQLNDVNIGSKDAVKGQAAKLIRSLTEFTSTLDELPEERWITIELKVREVLLFFKH